MRDGLATVHSLYEAQCFKHVQTGQVLEGVMLAILIVGAVLYYFVVLNQYVTSTQQVCWLPISAACTCALLQLKGLLCLQEAKMAAELLSQLPPDIDPAMLLNPALNARASSTSQGQMQ